MRLFVYEHITSGALIGETLPDSLAREGDAMLTALLHDLALLKHFQLHFMRDHRLAPINVNGHSHWITNHNDYQQSWQQCVNNNDYVLAIAPETDNILLDVAKQVPIADFLGASHTAIEICSDKLLTSKRLQQHHIATPDSYSAIDWSAQPLNDHAIIIKPIDGAGCLDTYLFSNQAQAAHYLSSLSQQQLSSLIVQPYISGTAASISLFIDDAIHILNINEQFISIHDQQLSFDDCKQTAIVNHLLSIKTATQLAESITHAIDGLWGFIGIDLVLTESGPVVIEINPRLTTSYLDLKNHLDFNPATLLLKAITQK